MKNGFINAPRGLPVFFLIAANSIPLLGVMFWGWSVAAVLLVYWLESAVIGVLNIPRIWATRGAAGSKLFTSLFFAVHYGAFAFAHLTVLRIEFGADTALAELTVGGPLFWTAAGFVFSHFISLLVRLQRKEFKDITPNKQLFAPYGRVMVMHIVVLVGAVLIKTLDSPIYAVALLVLLKTSVDLAAHRREGRAARTLESLQ